MLVVVDIAGIRNHAEIAKASGQDSFCDAADVALVLHAVADEIGYREHFDPVLFAEFDELRHASHGAVFIHDFADDAAGIEASDTREVDAGFRLTGADEHAAIAGAQWEHVAGAGEILRAGLGINGGENGDGAVRSADARGHAHFGVDRFGKGGAVDAGVDR